MRIITSSEPKSSARLIEADDFKHFAVVVQAPENADTLRHAAAAFGRTEGHRFVFIDPDALRRLPGAKGNDVGWLSSLEAMLQFARSKGWVDDAGMVRAHVEWVD
jgi:hypothetical protein